MSTVKTVNDTRKFIDNKPNRLPRPLGVSILLQEYYKTKDPNIKDRAVQICIQHWMISGGYLFGEVVNLTKLCECLQIPVNRVQNQMKENMINTKIWEKGSDNEELMANLIGTQLAWAMEDRMEVDGQLGILKDSQAGVYMPFISSEVTKAIDLKTKTTKNMSDIIKGLTGGGSINIFNQQNNDQNQVHVGVTMEEAVALISSELKQVTRPEEVLYIEAQYEEELKGLPEVVANRQLGIDTSKEGLNMGRDELLRATDDYKGSIETIDEIHHEIRRELEMNLDIDAEDPELEKY